MSDRDFKISHHLFRFVISIFKWKILHFIAFLGSMVSQKQYNSTGTTASAIPTIITKQDSHFPNPKLAQHPSYSPLPHYKTFWILRGQASDSNDYNWWRELTNYFHSRYRCYPRKSRDWSNIEAFFDLVNLKLVVRFQDSQGPTTSEKGKGKADNSQQPKDRSLNFEPCTV